MTIILIMVATFGTLMLFTGIFLSIAGYHIAGLMCYSWFALYVIVNDFGQDKKLQRMKYYREQQNK